VAPQVFGLILRTSIGAGVNRRPASNSVLTTKKSAPASRRVFPGRLIKPNAPRVN